MHKIPGNHRFTLVELLVVIGVISLLAAMLLPSMSRARYSARLASCQNNLRQVGVGVLAYAVKDGS